MILLLGALDGEISPFIENLEDCKEIFWRGFPVYTGRLSGRSVVIGRTGAGKIQTTLLIQHLIENYAISSLIFTGIAGGINPDYRTGDLVISQDCMQHDMDAVFFGYEPGQVPGTEYRIFSPDPVLFSAAASYKARGFRIHCGRILSGDRFVAGRERTLLREELSGDLVEMEGAAAAMTAQINGIPWLVIRIISDMADGTLPPRFGNFISRAAKRNLDLVHHILTILNIQNSSVD